MFVCNSKSDPIQKIKNITCYLTLLVSMNDKRHAFCYYLIEGGLTVWVYAMQVFMRERCLHVCTLKNRHIMKKMEENRRNGRNKGSSAQTKRGLWKMHKPNQVSLDVDIMEF